MLYLRVQCTTGEASTLPGGLEHYLGSCALPGELCTTWGAVHFLGSCALPGELCTTGGARALPGG